MAGAVGDESAAPQGVAQAPVGVPGQRSTDEGLAASEKGHTGSDDSIARHQNAGAGAGGGGGGGDDIEKPPFLYVNTDSNGSEEAFDDGDPRIRNIPPHVKRVVSFSDDPKLPTITFRYFLLTFLFVAPGAFLSQLTRYRTTYAPYSVFFVQIASSYVGEWLANLLPAWNVRVPFTGRSFSLNPGPFSVKEHVLITISAASGATYNLAYTPISLSELYFNYKVNPAVAIFFMWAIVWVGYSYAAIARQFLIYDPQFPWFYSLCQTALFEAQKKQRQHPTRESRKRMRVFFYVLLAVTLWQFLPEFVWPMLGSLAFLCWVAPNNSMANFLGAGFGGSGMLNLSLDWSSLSTHFNLFLTPWYTQVIFFAAFVVTCWILIPIAKFKGLGSWNQHLMSNHVFLGNGSTYPLTQLLTSDLTLNETAYQELGTPHAGAHFLWTVFFDYAAYSSALIWMVLFGYEKLRASASRLWSRRKKGAPALSEQFNDQLSILQRSYPEVPLWWYLALFTASFVVILAVTASGSMFIPVWTFIVAIATGAVIVVPLGWLYALSNYQLPIGTTNELLYGLMVNAVNGYKNPCGASTYGSIAGDAWYRAQLQLQDMKIGHYMHVPPRDVFFAQIFGSFIGIPINYGVIRWVLNTKSEYLTGAQEDPTHQWTGQEINSALTIGVQYVLLGPKRLFQLPLWSPLPYGFILGAVAPFVFFGLDKLFPRFKFRLWNTTIFFSAMSIFYGNISAGYTSLFLGGFVVMFWAYRYRYNLWVRWNYLLAAAFDAGFNLNELLIFLFFGAGKVITMPNWWGNDAASSERCFSLNSD